MKLNKTEMEVIAGRLAKKVVAVQETAQIAAIKQIDKSNMKKAEALHIELSKLSKEAQAFIRGNFSKYDHPTFNQGTSVKALLPHLRKNIPAAPNHYAIKGNILEELIITQIECPDVIILQKKVGKLFGI